LTLAGSVFAGARLYSHGDHEGALAEAEQALALIPNLASAHHVLAATLIFSGRPQEGLVALPGSLRLDPHEPMQAVRLNFLALGLYFSSDYNAAAAERALGTNPEYPLPYRGLLQRSATSVEPRKRSRLYIKR
jgi:hypothetical protein